MIDNSYKNINILEKAIQYILDISNGLVKGTWKTWSIASYRTEIKEKDIIYEVRYDAYKITLLRVT